jgi:hypothetical protein
LLAQGLPQLFRSLLRIPIAPRIADVPHGMDRSLQPVQGLRDLRF